VLKKDRLSGSVEADLKYIMPVGLFLVGATFFLVGLRVDKASDVHHSLNTITSMCMLISGFVCWVVAGITLFMRKDLDDR
jgi:hypothetical protein